jgi:hypothetical protein
VEQTLTTKRNKIFNKVEQILDNNSRDWTKTLTTKEEQNFGFFLIYRTRMIKKWHLLVEQ